MNVTIQKYVRDGQGDFNDPEVEITQVVGNVERDGHPGENVTIYGTEKDGTLIVVVVGLDVIDWINERT